MLTITPSPAQPVTRITCPSCKKSLPRIALAKNSTVSGLLFVCKCGYKGNVKTE